MQENREAIVVGGEGVQFKISQSGKPRYQRCLKRLKEVKGDNHTEILGKSLSGSK